MDDDHAFYDNGEWVTWTQIGEWEERSKHEDQIDDDQEEGDESNSVFNLDSALETLLSLAETHYHETGRHLNVYGDIGELFGASELGIKLHDDMYQEGSDGILGDKLVEIKTITPFKNRNQVIVKQSGNFDILLIVRVDEYFEISFRMVDRASLPKQKGKYFRIDWNTLQTVKLMSWADYGEYGAAPESA